MSTILLVFFWQGASSIPAVEKFPRRVTLKLETAIQSADVVRIVPKTETS